MARERLMRVTLLCVAVVGVAALGAVPSGAQDGTPAPGFGSEDLPEGASFEPITQGTVDDVLAISRLVAVYRITLSAGAGRITDTDTPGLYYALDGALSASVDEDMLAPALLSRRAPDGGFAPPVLVLPGTGLDLLPGELLVNSGRADEESPYGYVGFDNAGETPVAYLDVEFFPSGGHWGGSGGEIEEEPLDVSLGLATAQEPAPPVFTVGRLTIEPGASVPLDDVSPALLIAERGPMALTVDAGEAQVKRSGVDFDEAPETVEGKAIDLASDDAAFVLPGTAGAIGNAGGGPAVLLVLSFVGLPAAELGTPVP